MEEMITTKDLERNKKYWGGNGKIVSLTFKDEQLKGIDGAGAWLKKCEKIIGKQVAEKMQEFTAPGAIVIRLSE